MRRATARAGGVGRLPLGGAARTEELEEDVSIPAGLDIVLDLGFEVFPCRTKTIDDKHKVKAPLTAHGKDDATADRRQIAEWAREFHNPAWGARPPQGTTVLDIDTKKSDGFDTLRRLETQHTTLPSTLTSHTPSNGEHRIFTTPKDYKNRAGVRPGLDVRSHGGYIVVPPSVIEDGEYRWINPEQPVATAPDWLIEEVFAHKESKSTLKHDLVPDGARNDTLYRFACGLRGRNLPDKHARAMLWARNADCMPPLDDNELEKIFARAWSHPPGFPLTDLGNAERLVAHHGNDWRYLPEVGWCRFDGVRWADDRTDEIRNVCADVARGILREALTATDDYRPRLALWAVKSESRDRLSAMESLARSQIVDLLERYDADPFLLAVNNGVVDLRTGACRAASREDRLRLRAEVEYDPEATAPKWEQFLSEIFETPEMRRFVQRALGYSVTGSTVEQKIFIAFGTGANGKTTLIETIRRILGGYAKTIQPETLMVKDRGGSIPNDIARLVGARFVPTSEVEDGKKFAESVIKQMTGGEAMSARFMRQEWFDFVPVCKLWVLTNHRPVITGNDHAIWRRITLIPFSVTIADDKKDLTLSATLLAEASGILNWLLAGVRAWRAEGLALPEKVQLATAQYRADMDLIGQFLKEETIAGNEVRKSWVYERYKQWCDESGVYQMKANRFHGKLREEHKLTTKTRDGYELYVGIELRDRL